MCSVLVSKSTSEEKETPKEATWKYIDEAGQEQGPYKRSEMKAWFDAGYFPDANRLHFSLSATRIRNVLTETEFIAIGLRQNKKTLFDDAVFETGCKYID